MPDDSVSRSCRSGESAALPSQLYLSANTVKTHQRHLAVRFDVRWKAAIGVAVDDPGFDPSSLVY